MHKLPARRCLSPHRLAICLAAITVVFTLTLNAARAAAPVPTDPLPFKAGERLTYELKYGIITAGYAVFEVHDHTRADGSEALRFELSVRTQGLVDKLFQVRDVVESLVSTDVGQSYAYRKQQHEGKSRKTITIRFDHDAQTAQYSTENRARDPISITSATLDPLSAFYRFRMAELRRGNAVELPVTDGKETYEGIVNVRQRQRIVVGGKSYDTWYVEPDLKDMRGVFEKSGDATLGIWFTADDQRLPVKVQSRVAIGSFVAELVKVENLQGPR